MPMNRSLLWLLLVLSFLTDGLVLALAPPRNQPSLDEFPHISRRTIIQRILISSSVPTLVNTLSYESAHAEDPFVIPNLSCLEDLPPIQPSNTVRIFLCRHGQTENNRLRKVQGARVDPPLNDTGRRQALRMGEALSNYFRNGNTVLPKFAIHSNLQRAKETATIVSLTMGLYRDPAAMYDPQIEDSDFEYIRKSLTSEREGDGIDSRGLLGLQTLNSLNEVDFGSLEGKSVNEAKATMMYTFGQWGLGRLDSQNDGGESGRDVIARASQALIALRDVAIDNGGCAIAVSHSTYLRVLLAMVMDMSLLEAGTMTVNNCSIHVLDLDCKETIQLRQSSAIFGGKFSLAPKDFKEKIPVAKVVRLNEIRHLSGLL